MRLLLLPWLLLIPSASAFVTAPPFAPALQAEARPWLGCWSPAPTKEAEAASADEDAALTEPLADCLWFEAERVGWLTKGRASFHRVRYTERGARLESWARFVELELELDGDRLRVRKGAREQLFERRARVPEALRVVPYELPDEVELDPSLLETIQFDLRDRRIEDQAVRAGGRLAPNASEVDEENTAYMIELIEEFGWIDARRFGAEAADAAFLLVQHSSDLRLQRTALPLIEADVRAGRLDGQAFALLHDRLALRLGRLQRYGSQIAVIDDDQPVLMPCEDFARVDERRAEMGMGPLGEYLALFERGGKGVRRLEELESH